MIASQPVSPSGNEKIPVANIRENVGGLVKDLTHVFENPGLCDDENTLGRVAEKVVNISQQIPKNMSVGDEVHTTLYLLNSLLTNRFEVVENNAKKETSLLEASQTLHDQKDFKPMMAVMKSLDKYREATDRFLKTLAVERDNLPVNPP